MTAATVSTENASEPADKKHSGWWVWGVCGLLLLASSINYMDRQTLSTISVRITNEFGLTNQQYGQLEKGFGWSFAIGALVFGWLADRVNIRWLYPAVLLAWSAMGFLTGLTETFVGLLLCRSLLGLFEAGHWPCALKTTQRLLPPSRRTLGNSVLQSGTAIGAIITPKILLWMLTDAPGSWRPAFQVIGLVGVGWVILWLTFIRGAELAPLPATAVQVGPKGFLEAILHRRFLTLMVVVVLINASYHLFRVWLPKFLQEGCKYTEPEMLDFMFWFYIANDVGCLLAGFLTAGLHRWGWSVHRGRVVVFAGCALLTALSGLLPWLSAGPTLLNVLLLVSMGSLGMFPCYYAFSQELSYRHQGKVTGLLGTVAWFCVAPLHEFFGWFIDVTGSSVGGIEKVGHFDWGLAVAGLLPVAAVLAILIGWGPDREEQPAAA